MKTTNHYRIANIASLSIIIGTMACSSGSSSSTTVTGSVTAPGGGIAFNTPSKLQRFASSIFGKPAIAAISGVSSVGSGVTIELIEVDASGNKVGATIESTTTDSNGAYSLTTSKSANSKYVIRATGTTETLDVRYSTSAIDIDPVSDAVSGLVTSTASDLTTMSTTEITELRDAINGIVQNIDPTGLSAANLAAAIKTETTNNEELNNQLTSTINTESICGNVKDASSNNLGNIKIVVRDFGNWVTRAKTKTDSNGDYCVNVPAGDYILGALNFTSTSMAASEWWHTSGTKYSQIDAEKITVATSAAVTKNFSLEAGARVEGTITAGVTSSLTSGAAIEGVSVKIRQYQNFFPVGGKRTNVNGKYRINIIPGNYQIEAVNRTRYNYASEMYDDSTGTSSRFLATKMTITVGSTTTRDFSLEAGFKVSGQVLDNTGGNVVTGTRVRIQGTSNAGPSFRLRTNKQGKYRIWLKPVIYDVESHGQIASAVDLSTSNKSQNFTSQVGTLTATIKDGSGTGVSQAKVWLTNTSGTSISAEVSSSDGTVTLYSPTTGNHLMYVRIDENKTYASSIWNGKTQLLSGDLISITVGSTTAHGDVTLPTAGLLSVNVTTDGTTAVANYRGQIRSGGNGSTNRFITHRTLSNGNFILSIPAGTYTVRMISASTNCTSVNVTAGMTTTLNFRTDTSACS